MKKRIVFTALLAALLVFVAGCVSGNAATIKVGDETIPSLYSVVGEKKITGTYSGAKAEAGGSVTQTTVTYGNGDVTIAELNKYITKLTKDDGYMITQDAKSNGDSQSYQVGKNASKKGNIILISFVFSTGETKINYAVGTGTITPETASTPSTESAS